ncbi:MAG: DUF6036 family nucleotidyltransferase, partial [Chthoniobacteraceae bacterium]
MAPVSDFLQDVDRRWTPTGDGYIVLSVIGSAALMLQTGYQRGTKDSDVLETTALTADLQGRLLALAGKGTALHTRHGLYLDIVSQAIPFLPQVPLMHPLRDVNRTLNHFEIEVLDIVDVVVSKLKRFHANDVSDIRALVRVLRNLGPAAKRAWRAAEQRDFNVGID